MKSSNITLKKVFSGLLAAALGMLFSISAAHAQDVWTGGDGGSWSTSSNWNNGVPGSGANVVFNSVVQSTDDTSVSLNSLNFNASAGEVDLYAYYFGYGGPTLSLTGPGIISSGTESIIDLYGAEYSGTSLGNSGASSLIFYGSSSSSNAFIYNEAGFASPSYAYSSVPGAVTIFTASSNAGSSTIHNYGAADPSSTLFDGQAVVTGAGTTQFGGASSAASATIDNYSGASGAGSPGITYFAGYANAGSAHIENLGANGNVTYGGITYFQGNSSAANATLHNSGGINGGAGGVIYFQGNSNAGSAGIYNAGGGAGSGWGYTDFSDYSSANSATIYNEAGSSSPSGGATYFTANSTAANAIIYNNGGVSGAIYGGDTTFSGSSSAGNSTIYSYAGATGANGGTTYFEGNSTAGSATLIAFGAGNLQQAGNFYFLNSASAGGGTAVFDGQGGFYDISDSTGTFSVGTIEGSGNIYLGSNNLTVGALNQNTAYSGVISDVGGFNNVAGGSLTKVGTGTLTLGGANTYTGGTTVNAGTLAVNGSVTGNVAVNSGGTLGGSGTVGGKVAVASGGSTYPGDPQILTAGSAEYQNGSTAQFSIATTSGSSHPPTPGVDYDQIKLTSGAPQSLLIDPGTTTLQLNLSAASLAYLQSSANPNDLYFIFSLGSGTSSGQFSDLTLTEGANSYTDPITDGMATFSQLGLQFNLSYTASEQNNSLTGGNDVAFDAQAIPEPSTWALLLGGLGLLAFWHRRTLRSGI